MTVLSSLKIVQSDTASLRICALENEEVSEIPVRTRVRPWWIQDKDGPVLFWVKYGNQTLEFQKGKTAIRTKCRDDLVRTFQTVSDAVRSGELDDPSTERFRSSKAGSASAILTIEGVTCRPKSKFKLMTRLF